METLYFKELRKKNSKISRDELRLRRKFLDEFKVNIEELKRLSTYNFGTARFNRNDLDAFSGESNQRTGLDGVGYMNKLSGKTPILGSDGEADSEVVPEGVAQLRTRDKNFDELLDRIGLAVDRAGEQAKLIHDQTNLQNVKLDAVEQGVQKVREKLNNVNVRMKESLVSKGCGFEKFCTSCVCCIILLAIIGVAFSIAF